MTAPTSRALSARIHRLRAADPRWIVDYGLWKLNRLEDRLPRDTEARLGPLVQETEFALQAVTGLDTTALSPLRAEFADLLAEQYESSTLYGVADSSLIELQYVVTRALRPAAVVETGVWRGLSSWTILAALDANGYGELTSIDFPPLDSAQQVEVGHLVPARLRGRWTLELGPSRQLLPQVLDRISSLGVFVHDSDHTTANMTREYRVAWRAMRKGSVLISDDIDANHAFVRFAGRVGCTPVVLPQKQRAGYLGMLRKTTGN